MAFGETRASREAHLRTIEASVGAWSEGEIRNRIHAHREAQTSVRFLVQGVAVGLAGNLVATAIQHFVDKMDYPALGWRDAAWLVMGVLFLVVLSLSGRGAWQAHRHHARAQRVLEGELARRGP